MPIAPPGLLPLFRSETQMRLLSTVFFDDPATGADLARRLQLPQQTVADELARLEASGLVKSTRVGRAKVYRPAEDLPFLQALRQVLAYAGGIIPILRDTYAPIAGVSEVFIFGSWARRYHGEPGPPPNDVDVVIVSPTLTAFDLAEQRLAVEKATGLHVDQFVLEPTNPRLEELRDGSVPVLTRPT